MTTVFCGQVGCWSPRAVEKLADCPVEDEVLKRKDVSRDGVVIALGLGFVVFESVFVYKLPPQFSPHASFAVIVKAGKRASLKDLFCVEISMLFMLRDKLFVIPQCSISAWAFCMMRSIRCLLSG